MNKNSLNLDFGNYMNRSIKKSSIELSESIKNESSVESYDSLNFEIANISESYIENAIRQMFNRKGSSNTYINDHPDFKDLVHNGESINQYICPLFIDIRGSTRLGLVYPLEFVRDFKNAVIRMCIEVVRAFDGYVHRIMGDAVLAFFGSSSISEEQAIIDTLNAVCILDFLLLNSVRPYLESTNPYFEANQHFGFRIGINYGSKDEVLWSNYGYGKAGEVSATGFPIDVAAKLQSLADKNTTMLGQGLLHKINFPKNFSTIKLDKESNPMKFVKPNYTIKGTPINYNMRILNKNEYMKGLFISTEAKEKLFPKEIKSDSKFTLNVSHKNGGVKYPFFPNTVVPKNHEIIITVIATYTEIFGKRFKVYFEKINNEGENNESSFVDDYTNNGLNESLAFQEINSNNLTATFKRDCTFRGIHRVKCSITDWDNKVVYSELINIPIM